MPQNVMMEYFFVEKAKKNYIHSECRMVLFKKPEIIAIKNLCNSCNFGSFGLFRCTKAKCSEIGVKQFATRTKKLVLGVIMC